MSDIQVKLTEFSDLIDSYTTDFVGREWLVKQVDALLADPACRFVILTGSAGVGKTAFMAHLAATHPQWLRYFIRRDSRELLSGSDAKTFFLTIGGQLATLHPELFKPAKLEIIVRERIGDLESNGEAVGVRIEELKASPFYSVSILAELEIQRAAGKATAVQIGRLITEPRLLAVEDLQYLGLIDPALLLYQEKQDSRIVVLLDALDELRFHATKKEKESEHSDNTDILKALLKLPRLPSNLRFVVTSRPDQLLNRLLGRSDVCELPLNVKGDANREDLANYARNYIAVNLSSERLMLALADEKVEKTNEEFVADLLHKAAGNFLYLRSVLVGIKEALGDPKMGFPKKEEQLHGLLHVENLPDGLDELYDYFLDSIVGWVKDSGLGEAVWREYLRPLLGILAVARQPLSEAQLLAFTNLASEDLGDLLRELRQFVESVQIVGEKAFQIFHTSFAEYLLDTQSNRDYRIDGPKWHRRIADFYWEKFREAWPELKDTYGLNFLAFHLYESKQFDRLQELISQEWMAARFRGDGFRYAGFLTDLDLAIKAARPEELEPGNRTKPANWPALIRLGLLRTSLASLGHEFPPQILAQAVMHGLWSSRQALDLATRIPQAAQRRTAYELLLATGKLNEEDANEAKAGIKAAKSGSDDDAVHDADELAVDSPTGYRLKFPCTPRVRAAVKRILKLESQGKLAARTRTEAMKLSIPLPRHKRREIEPPGDWENLLDALVNAYAPHAVGADFGKAHAKLLQQLGVRIQFVAYNPAKNGHPILAFALRCCWDESLAVEYGQAALNLTTPMPEYLRGPVFAKLATAMPDKILPQMLQEVLNMPESQAKQRILDLMAPRLSSTLLLQILTELRQVRGDERFSLGIIQALLPGLQGPAYEQAADLALQLACSLPAAEPSAMRSPRAEALSKLIPLLPISLCSEAVQESEKATSAIPLEENASRVAKAQAIALLVPLQSGEHRRELVKTALDVAYFAEETAFWAPTLSTLYREMEPTQLARKLQTLAIAGDYRTLQRQILEEYDAGHPLDYAMVARLLLHESSRTLLTPAIALRALLSVVSDLDTVGIDEALEVVQGLHFRDSKLTTALIALGPRMNDRQARKALEIAEGISSFRFQAAVVGSVAARLPDAEQANILRTGLRTALELIDPDDRSAAMGALAADRPAWVKENIDSLSNAAARLLQPEPTLPRSTYLQRMTDLHPIWSAVIDKDALEAIARIVIDVCRHWQWK